MKNIELKIKEAQLDLLDELVRICEKKNINYCLIAGTLIGAIRHNGFIPWDDDIDVGMTRENYNRFLEACKIDLGKEYELYNWNNDIYYPHPFSKLKIKGTHYTEELSKDSSMNDSIFIDIFPYDNVPKSKIKQFFQKNVIKFYRKAILLKCNFSIIGNSFLKKILYFPVKLYSKTVSKEMLIKKIDSEAQKYNNENSEFITNHGGSYSYEREMANKDWLINTTRHVFEGIEYNIPKQYDAFLTHVYGDYMKLPPKSQRKGKHKVVRIDFGNYKIKAEGRIKK